MNTQILDKLLDIEVASEKLYDNITSTSVFTGIGILPVYYFYRYLVTKESAYKVKLTESLERVIELVNDNEQHISYCNGLAGVAFMLNFVSNLEILNEEDLKDLKSGLDYIDAEIAEASLQNTGTIDDVDFLHGSFGAALYLLERFKTTSSQDLALTIKMLFKKLASLVLADIKETARVQDIVTIADDTHKTNCGLAHGHISYILIFCKYLKIFPEDTYVKEALTASVQCVLNFESTTDNTFSVFPGIAVNKQSAVYKIALGWCYGDQTISLGLYEASVILKDPVLKQKAIDLAYKTLERDTPQKMFPTGLCDAGFCHGLSSIAYINKKWFSILGDSAFYNRYEQLIEDIMLLGNADGGVAGYKKLLGPDKFENCIGFLDGTLGISIVLMDYLLGSDNYGWDAFFLLDVNTN